MATGSARRGATEHDTASDANNSALFQHRLENSTPVIKDGLSSSHRRCRLHCQSQIDCQGTFPRSKDSLWLITFGLILIRLRCANTYFVLYWRESRDGRNQWKWSDCRDGGRIRSYNLSEQVKQFKQQWSVEVRSREQFLFYFILFFGNVHVRHSISVYLPEWSLPAVESVLLYYFVELYYHFCLSSQAWPVGRASASV